VLTMTPNAVAVIEQITSDPEAPDGAGLRITAQPEGYQLSVSAAPGQGDQVIEAEGARLFLDPAAAVDLGDKTLDAQIDPAGSAQFFLAEQSG